MNDEIILKRLELIFAEMLESGWLDGPYDAITYAMNFLELGRDMDTAGLLPRPEMPEKECEE